MAYQNTVKQKKTQNVLQSAFNILAVTSWLEFTKSSHALLPYPQPYPQHVCLFASLELTRLFLVCFDSWEPTRDIYFMVL